MNKVILMGRLCADPDIKYTSGTNPTAVARYRLAVNRRFKREGEPESDFITCVAFGKQGEFAEKWLHKGTRIVISGRIQTGSYTNRDGVKVYTTDIVVEEQEFAESKSAGSVYNQNTQRHTDSDGFMNIPDNIDEDLPFN